MGVVELGFFIVFIVSTINEGIIQLHDNPPRIEWHSENLAQEVPDYINYNE